MEIGAQKQPDDLRSIEVNLGERRYPIYVGHNILHRAVNLIQENLPDTGKVTIFTHEAIFKLHGNSLETSLENAGIQTQIIFIPEGEASKSWDIAGKLFGDLIDFGMDRSSMILAFGGGVVGDLAGFLASTYLRGINLIQIPTTFLGQVDSGIGGKTAVNHPRGKNLIGTFYQPKMVFIDSSLLETLPMRELKAGIGEVVKYGVIADIELFNLLEKNAESILQKESKLLIEIIASCCAVKARLVELDERDNKGFRIKLNYGHTVGHALEVITQLDMRHGEAIAIGMIIASEISNHLGIMQEEDVKKQENLIRLFGLPTQLPKVDIQMLLDIMHRDKKTKKGAIRFVLPTGIGKEPVVKTISDSFLIKILKTLMG